MAPHFFILKLNDMRSSRIQLSEAVAWSEDPDSLQQFLDRERVEKYTDGRWDKCFHQGGPLEWCNEPWLNLGQGVIQVSPGEIPHVGELG